MLALDKSLPFGLSARNWYWFLIGFVALLAVTLVGDAYFSRALVAVPEPLRGFFFTITDLGLSDWILIPSLILLLISLLFAAIIPKRIPRLALLEMSALYGFIFVGVGLPGLIANLIKRGIGRGRPVVLDAAGHLDFHNFINDWDYQSFPSGHATTIFAFAVVVGFLSRRWLVPMLIVALLVGISRIVVGLHYPTDVLGGAVLGIIGAYAVRNAFATRRWVFQRLSGGAYAVRPFSAVRRLVRTRR